MTHLKQRLASKSPLLGTFLKTPSPMICEVLGRSSMDLVCLDAEHSPFDRRDIDACLLSLRSVGKPTIVRVQSATAEHILNALDCGSDGILAPHIINREDAERIAALSRYGEGRGYAGSTRAAGYMDKKMNDHKADSNAQACVIAQIEDAEALENLDQLFTVKNIDCFFIGRADLTISMGFDDVNDPRVLNAVERICKAGAAAKRCVGMFTGNLDEIPKWRSLGASLFLLGSDHDFMLRGANDFAEKARAGF